jgi:hypothetical protein
MRLIPDATGGYGGAGGGINRGGFILSPIIFPAKPIDVSEGKVVGGRKSALVNSDSSSDSLEDEEEDYTHKRHKLAQVAQKGQPPVVEIRADCAWEGGCHEAIFAKEFKGSGTPSHILEPLRTAHKQMRQLGGLLPRRMSPTIVLMDHG